MPNRSYSAGHFSLSIDGREVATAEEALVARAAPPASPAKPPGILIGSDLTMKRGIVAPPGAFPLRSSTSAGLLVLKKVKFVPGRQILLLTGKRHALLAKNNDPVARYHLTEAWPSTSFNGGDIAMEEVVIAHEGIQLMPGRAT